jgi:hypothetical protein
MPGGAEYFGPGLISKKVVDTYISKKDPVGGNSWKPSQVASY